MKRKRIFCAVLALMFAIACAAPGYAGGADAEEALSLEAETAEQPELSPEPVESFAPDELPALEDPTEPEESPDSEEIPALETDTPELVNVTVPANGKIIINPYSLPVETAAGISTEQIISETLDIVNTSEAPVIVSASVKGRVAEQSSAVYVSSPPPPDTPEKEIFLYAEFQNEDGQWSGEYSGGDNQILVSPADTELKEVLTLDAASRGLFRLFGSTAMYPADPWCSNDEISVTVVFKFVPAITPEDAQVLDEESPAPEEPADPQEPPVEEEPADAPEPPVEEEPTDAPEPPIEEEPLEAPEPTVETELPYESGGSVYFFI